MDEDSEFEVEDLSEIVEMSDLLVGFSWHNDGQHWDLATVSFPDTFSDQEVERLQDLAAEFAGRLSEAGFTLPAEEQA